MTPGERNQDRRGDRPPQCPEDQYRPEQRSGGERQVGVDAVPRAVGARDVEEQARHLDPGQCARKQSHGDDLQALGRPA